MLEHPFLVELERALAALPLLQRKTVLDDYRAHIIEARGRGKSDTEIARALGDPRRIARTFIADYHLTRVWNPGDGQKITSSVYHMVRALLLVSSIVAFNFIFMLGPIVFLAAMLGVFWIVALVLFACGLIVAIAVLIGNIASPAAIGLAAQLAFSFYSLSIFGASILACFALYLLSRGFLMGLMKYIKMNAKVIQPN